MARDMTFLALRARANFLMSFRDFLHARGVTTLPVSVARADIEAWERENLPAEGARGVAGRGNPRLSGPQQGPLGRNLSWPSWLTGDRPMPGETSYRQSTGLYNVPWNLIEEYEEANLAREERLAAAKAAKGNGTGRRGRSSVQSAITSLLRPAAPQTV